ncbi:hypothetical protein [Streptomyces lavendulocolor]|uniref:hypothetical protein n=1 Tax=Streptomyces lavendulocolor TaxID=67316 RepID=UPI003C304716
MASDQDGDDLGCLSEGEAGSGSQGFEVDRLATGRPFSDEREAVRQELGALLDEDLYAAVQEQGEPCGDGTSDEGTDIA